MKQGLGKLLYGVLFIVILPALLVLWTIETEPALTLPAIHSVFWGVAVAFLGLLVMLAGMLALTLGHFVLAHFLKDTPPWAQRIAAFMDQTSLWYFVPVIPLLLLPLAMTMALLWKTKEVILDSVFGAK